MLSVKNTCLHSKYCTAGCERNAVYLQYLVGLTREECLISLEHSITRQAATYIRSSLFVWHVSLVTMTTATVHGHVTSLVGVSRWPGRVRCSFKDWLTTSDVQSFKGTLRMLGFRPSSNAALFERFELCRVHVSVTSPLQLRHYNHHALLFLLKTSCHFMT